MNRKTFLVGISVAALAAGSASAQSTNNATELCSPTSICTIDNDQPGNDRNNASLRVQGPGNSASIYQEGDDNVSIGEITGAGNDLESEQLGDDHRSEIYISGDDNGVYTYQESEANNAVVRVTGSDSFSSIYQGDDSAGAGGGENNTANVTLTGSNLGSYVEQAAGAGAASADRNVVTASLSGAGSYSYVEQSSSGNTATVTLLDGGLNDGTGNRENTSFVVQGNTLFQGGPGGTFVPGAPTGANNPDSGNVADVAIRGQQNTSTVNQNGVQLSAVVSILAGGPGNTGATPINGPDGTALPANRIQGNASEIFQTGRGHSAEISSGGSALFNGQGNQSSITQSGSVATGHTATVYQRGLLEGVTINQSTNALGGAGGTAVQSGSVADVAQLSINSTASITQVGTNTAIVTQGRNADTSGGDNSVIISQTDAGDEVIDPTDPFGGGGSVRTSSNSVEVAQYGISNEVNVTQNARNANATVDQRPSSRDVNATVNQTGGVSSLNLNASIIQADVRSNATINQTGTNQSAAVAQTGTAYTGGVVPNAATVTQSNAWNVANVSQSGNRLTATVNQAGTGTAARPNSVTITQSTFSNTATATQTAGVGPSGATAPGAGIPGNEAFPGSRPAGAASAEIRITQSNSGNAATVTQAGLGQYGSITQSGTGNTGIIDQQAGATNAVAIIEQTGNNNGYSITQNAAGQYFRVVQSGNANVSSSTITSGPSGGGTGTVLP